jgi:hypothetical protein
MTCIIKAVAFANGMPCAEVGQYLKSYDSNAYGGRGHVTWTPDPVECRGHGHEYCKIKPTEKLP